MRPWRSRTWADLGERYPRLATAGWAIAGVVGACLILALVAVLVGFALGSPGPTGSAPPVDFDDEPGTVVAAATERLSHRDFTVEEWVRTVDHRTGGVSGGMFFRLHVESSRGQVRGEFQRGSSYATFGAVGDGPAREVFLTRGAAWVRLDGNDYWQRSPPAANHTRDMLGFLEETPERLEGADLTVVVDNETSYVAEMAHTPGTDPDAVGAVRYVVEKGDDPHLREIRYVREGRLETTTRVIHVVNYGNATAPRPADVPWTTVEELRIRAVRGLRGLA